MIEILKHSECLENPHGCRLVCDGLVCSSRCERLQMDEPINPFPENEGT